MGPRHKKQRPPKESSGWPAAVGAEAVALELAEAVGIRLLLEVGVFGVRCGAAMSEKSESLPDMMAVPRVAVRKNRALGALGAETAAGAQQRPDRSRTAAQAP